MGGIEFADCNFGNFIGTEIPSFLTPDGRSAPPLVLDRLPADEATNQPLDVTLTWQLLSLQCALGVYYSSVYFGTEPDPPLLPSTSKTSMTPGHSKVKQCTTGSSSPMMAMLVMLAQSQLHQSVKLQNREGSTRGPDDVGSDQELYGG